MITIYEADIAVEKLRAVEHDLNRLFRRPVKVVFYFRDIGPVTEAKIMEVVEEVTGVSVPRMISREKTNEAVYARYHCYVLMKKHLPMNLSQIGRAFDRDHSTVISGMDVFKTLYKLDKSFRIKHDAIAENLRKYESGAKTDA